ncbi:hypothetical protein BABINDRAFT_7308 [Babjeviella inositovora NRRL Y-12698]|uniref:Ornithine cyclodeaminase n=1 Tax=Babjeviella inositovora NRRL Y-12698 TaxID=984486 RepID=A0A1E3QSW1_9ASCO|nr:uncharacterized protein BABINDRAFT_7308 [Babjeviella inositovora NRRL Y-12698]ODQ80594.1 hypothetical protein BABINDRAFT_7308 [Babjeviella inositovora NRRL Y-12698]
MMKVFNDYEIDSYLLSLNSQHIQRYQRILADVLLAYAADPTIIPQRTVEQTMLGPTHLFMPTTGADVGIKVLTSSQEGFKGATFIFSPLNGELQCVLNAYTLTAFRTALATTLALVKVQPISGYRENESLIVFGVGPQSFWHVKLTVTLYPGRFSTVYVANRTVYNAERFITEKFSSAFGGIRFVPLSTVSQDAEVGQAVAECSVIFGCTPSTVPVIRGEWLYASRKLSYEGSKFIGLIGSYKPHMMEIDSELVECYTQEHSFIVDSKEHTLHEAGEFISNSIDGTKLVEVSELWGESDHNFSLLKLVICKMVGLAIMDVAVGSQVMKDNVTSDAGVSVAF